MHQASRLNDFFGFLALLLILSSPQVKGNPISEPLYLERCTNDLDWVGTGFKKEDCLATVWALHNAEVVQHGITPFQFYARDRPPPHHGTPSRQTPIKYRHGK